MKTSFASAFRASLPALVLLVAFSIGCALAPPSAGAQTGTNSVTGITGTASNDVLHLLTFTNVSATLTFTTNTPHTVWTEATGIAGLAGDDQITTTAALQTEASSTIDLMFDQYDYRGQEAVAESTGISGGPGQNTITNAAALTSTARAVTDIDSVFCTVVFGVSGLPTITTASAVGILGGDAPDSLINFAYVGGVDDVLVVLYAADNDGMPSGSALASDTTEHGGYYLFDNLYPGDYVVVIPASNFTGTGVLVGYWSSGTALDIDGTGDIMEYPAEMTENYID